MPQNDYTDPVSRRVRIPTGLDCNENCRFCYYFDQLNTKRYTTPEMTAKIDFARERGIKDLDFSGGEPTLRKDLPELIKKARGEGFRRICIITNGTRTRDEGYFKGLVDCGMDEILLSVHGHDDATHSEAVGRKNSWQNIDGTVRNAKKYGVRLRTNTVVSKLNYGFLDKVAGYLSKIRPAAVNFICFNDWNRASELTAELACRYSEAAPALMKAVDVLADSVSKVSVRYVPFCFLPGYERHVCDILQNEYDPDEWIDPVKTAVTFEDPGGEKTKKYCGRLYSDFTDNAAEVMAGLEGLYRKEDLDNPGIFDGLPEKYMRIAHRADRAGVRMRGYVKANQCLSCSRRKICDGLEKTYADVIGTSELKTVHGRVIDDPFYFRRDYSKQWA